MSEKPQPCQWPEPHECGKTVAKVGLPRTNGLWVCATAFTLFQERPK